MKDFVKGKLELARRCGGISLNTLTRYMAKPGFPPATKDGWALDEVLAFIQANTDHGIIDAKLNSSLSDLKCEDLRVKIARAQFKLDQERGRFVLLADAQRDFSEFWGKFLSSLRQKLENEYPQAVAGLGVPEARIYGKRMVDDVCQTARQMLGEYLQHDTTS